MSNVVSYIIIMYKTRLSNTTDKQKQQIVTITNHQK